MQNDTAVFFAYAYNQLTCDKDIWVGNGTRQAIVKGGFYVGELVGWHPHQHLTDGWALRVKN
jgi:hypothetical protein